MSPTLTCLALALVGVDLGYQPTTNGRVEFIIQISPAMLQSLRPGDPIEIDADPGAQSVRPSKFTIMTGDGPLRRILPPASTPPAVAPNVAATPVMPAGATEAASSAIPPQYGGPSRSSEAHPGTPLGNNSSAQSPTPSSSGDEKFPALQQVDSQSNSSQPDHPWLAMCLFVIALAASNGYVGWLFWDARQRYLGLLARTFSVGATAG